MADLVKAISRIATQYIPNTKGDVQLGWIARINDYSGRLLAQAHPLAATLADKEAEAPSFDVPSDYFAVSEGDDPYIIGGSPSNPNGVTFTPSAAVGWWTDVFSHGLNISKVRSTLTPGSKVLSPDGLAAARLLGSSSLNFAPEDYNPLDLEVIP